LAELQREVGAGSPMTVSAAIRRFSDRLSRDKPLRKVLAQAVQQLQSHPTAANV